MARKVKDTRSPEQILADLITRLKEHDSKRRYDSAKKDAQPDR